MSLETSDKLDMGRQFDKDSLSSPGFLISEVTMDFLSESGKQPVDRDKLTIFVMVGIRALAHCFRRLVGMGSSSQCLLGI